MSRRPCTHGKTFVRSLRPQQPFVLQAMFVSLPCRATVDVLSTLPPSTPFLVDGYNCHGVAKAFREYQLTGRNSVGKMSSVCAPSHRITPRPKGGTCVSLESLPPARSDFLSHVPVSWISRLSLTRARFVRSCFSLLFAFPSRKLGPGRQRVGAGVVSGVVIIAT